MRLSICNGELDRILFSKPSKILIYGEAATGKTNLLLNIIKCSMNELDPSKAVFFISTEGSVFIDRALKLKLLKDNIFYSVALDQQHLISMILDILKNLERHTSITVFIDSINNHYRVEAVSHEGLALFVKLLILLNSLAESGSYILASAQVKFDTKEVPGHEYLLSWADIVLEVLKKPLYRVLRFRKPLIDTEFCFYITISGIRWIPCSTRPTP